jgi:hypothetical protein
MTFIYLVPNIINLKNQEIECIYIVMHTLTYNF